MYIDTHCHFDFHQFDNDRDACWKRAKKLGVKALILPGVEPEQWPRVARLCEEQDAWHFAVGLHPWWIQRLKLKASSLENRLAFYIEQSPCVAVGECGLDAKIDVPMRDQITMLEIHLELARKAKLPVILHCVKAQNELLQCLKNFPGIGGVVHAFSGSDQLARQFWHKGFYLGIGGVITYSRAQKTRAAVKAMPLESLVLETDAPDMPPAGYQGKRNSPENIPLVAAEIANLKGIGVDQVHAATSANAEVLFDRL